MKNYTLGSLIRTGAWGMLIGGVAGFTLGMLMAPEEGRKIRRRMAYQLEHLAAQVGTFVDQVVSSEAGSEARRTGDALVADAQARAQRIQDDIDALLGEVRQDPSSSSSSSAAE